jgi:molecular chaperone DnaK (HSP70)
MRLGVDLGTSRTVVAVADRGNFPIVGFAATNGDVIEHYPSLTAEVGGRLVHGLDAVSAAEEGAPALGSWKRLLTQHGASYPVTIGAVTVPLLELVTDYLSALRRDLFVRSNLPKKFADPLEAAVAVPANAHSTQRFVTLEAFRAAGFAVRCMMNEPSAAGLEYAHRYRGTLNTKRENVVVYDLGGGTFDAALVSMAGGQHDIVTTGGIARLGGDDFDETLLSMALEVAGVTRELAQDEHMRLLAECRAAKEGLSPNTRRLTLELSALGDDAPDGPVLVTVNDYYERLRPLVLRTLEAMDPVLDATGAERPLIEGAGGEELGAPRDLAGIYVVGGASGLPLVPRLLRERFARRVHRSPYPSAATAIGLAIAADAEAHPPVTERFTRHLGVFRERDQGSAVSFDGIFAKGTPMPDLGAPPLVVTRRYRAAHNMGYYRFVECGGLDLRGDPAGDITPHAEVRFPFVRGLRATPGLDDVMIQRLADGGPLVEERYEVDAAGVIIVTIQDLEDGYERRYVL